MPTATPTLKSLTFSLARRPNPLRIWADASTTLTPPPRARSHAEHHGILLHTGQQNDEAMKATFFEQFSIPELDVDLGVRSAAMPYEQRRLCGASRQTSTGFILARCWWPATSTLSSPTPWWPPTKGYAPPD